MDDMHFRDLFSFSRRERRGIIALLVIIILLIAIRANIHLILPSPGENVDTEFFVEVEKFLQSGNTETPDERIAPDFEISKQITEEKTPSKPATKQLFYFDPNTLNDSGWKQLGISDRQLKVINNYRQSGGRFFRKEDLRKIYGLDDQTYSRLEKYIRIDNRTGEKVENSAPAKEELQVIELNTADTFRLTLLRGIGPVYARRICKYRDLLGGFVSKKQLKEVYGITEDLVSINDTIISIDREEINKIDVNKAKFADLIRHPYLNEYQTRAIIQYREYRKRINDLSELVSNNILDKETYQLMKPYLKAGGE